MKKILIISLMALLVTPSFAKKKKEPAFSPSFAMRVGLGYAFPIAGGDAMVYDSHLQPINGSQSYDGTYDSYYLKRASFAAGFGATIAPCLMLNEHFGVEVAATFGLSMRKYTLHYTSTGAGNPATDNFTSYAKLPVVVIPSIVVSTGNTRLSAYARAGLALPVSGKIITEEQYADQLNGTQTSTFEVKNHISLGIAGAAGARYKMNNFTSLWVELNGMAISLRPKTGEYTSYVQNGQSVLGAINTSDTHFEYEQNYSERNNNSSSQPTKATAFSSPFSSLGLSVGVSLNL